MTGRSDGAAIYLARMQQRKIRIKYIISCASYGGITEYCPDDQNIVPMIICFPVVLIIINGQFTWSFFPIKTTINAIIIVIQKQGERQEKS